MVMSFFSVFGFLFTILLRCSDCLFFYTLGCWVILMVGLFTTFDFPVCVCNVLIVIV